MPSSTHPLVALSAIPDLCHPERSRAMSEAHRLTKSKDPYELVLPPAMEQFSPVRQHNAIHTQQ
jgi:hypothetical protein